MTSHLQGIQPSAMQGIFFLELKLVKILSEFVKLEIFDFSWVLVFRQIWTKQVSSNT